MSTSAAAARVLTNAKSANDGAREAGKKPVGWNGAEAPRPRQQSPV